MQLINCQNYNAIKITHDNYILLNDKNAPYKYCTVKNTLFCSLRNTPYCYIGTVSQNGETYIYCNRVSAPIDFDNLCHITEVSDLAFYADIIPVDLHFKAQVRWICDTGNPYANLIDCDYAPINIKSPPDWSPPRYINEDETFSLLCKKMGHYDTSIERDETGDINPDKEWTKIYMTIYSKY